MKLERKQINKKAQHEIMGFVLIIVMVAILALIFIGFYLRKSATTSLQESQDASNFLQAVMQVTSSCKISSQYGSMQDIIKACYKGESCEDGASSCSILNSTISSIIKSEFSSDKPVKAYNFRIYLDKTNNQVLSLNSGNMTGSCYSGQQRINTVNGDLVLELRLCY